jgi:hypothetical protein
MPADVWDALACVESLLTTCQQTFELQRVTGNLPATPQRKDIDKTKTLWRKKDSCHATHKRLHMCNKSQLI